MQDITRVALVGSGVAGTFFAQGMAGAAKVRVDVFEPGPPFNKRKLCPIARGDLTQCPEPICGYCGPSKGGFENDAKLNLDATPSHGNHSLYELIGKSEFQRYLDVVYETFRSHAPVERPIFSPDQTVLDWIKPRAEAAGMLYQPQRFTAYGTDNAMKIAAAIQESISEAGPNINFRWKHQVQSVARQGSGFLVRYSEVRNKNLVNPKEGVYDVVVISVGRGGSRWLANQPFYPDLAKMPGIADIGVRLETRASVTRELDRRTYEAKFYKVIKDLNNLVVRNFCNCPTGLVTPEPQDDCVLVNGHCMAGRPTDNTNFAVLAKLVVSQPERYSVEFAKRVNEIGGGRPVVQLFGDLLAGRATTPAALARNWIQPTLESTPGDITPAYPPEVLAGIIEYIHAFDEICPGIAREELVIHAPECKILPDVLVVDEWMRTSIPDVLVIGDTSGWTRGITPAACSALMAAEGLLRRLGLAA